MTGIFVLTNDLKPSKNTQRISIVKIHGIIIDFIKSIHFKIPLMSSTKRKVYALILSALLAVDVGVVAFIIHKII